MKTRDKIEKQHKQSKSIKRSRISLQKAKLTKNSSQAVIAQINNFDSLQKLKFDKVTRQSNRNENAGNLYKTQQKHGMFLSWEEENRAPLKVHDSNCEIKWTTLNISPKELTITELKNPDDEDLLKANYATINSTTEYTAPSSKNNKKSATNSSHEEHRQGGYKCIRDKLNKFYSQRGKNSEHFLYKDDQILIHEFHDENADQDDAKIIETEEAEENNLGFQNHKIKPLEPDSAENLNFDNSAKNSSSKSKSISVSNILNGISSIDITNGVGEISDVWSSDNNMVNAMFPNDSTDKRAMSPFSPNSKTSIKNLNSNKARNYKIQHQKVKSSVWLPNMLYFKSKR